VVDACDNPRAMATTQTVILTTVLSSLSAAAERALEERPLPPELGQRQFRRTKGAAGGYDAEAHTVTMAVSSEYPVQRYGGDEILSHAQGAIDLERLKDGIALLFNHDYNLHLGTSVGYELKDGVLRITNKFGTNPLAREKEQDVADKILKDVSIGYQPLEYDITEDKTGYRTYTVTRWELYENSLVTVPADPTVGVDRNAPAEVHVKVNFRILDADPEPPQERSQTPDSEDEDDDEEEVDDPDDPEAGERTAASTTPTTQPTQQRNQTMAEATTTVDHAANEKARVTALRNLRQINPSHYSEDQVMQDIVGGVSIERATDAIAERAIAAGQNSNVPTIAGEQLERMSPKEQRLYSRAGAARAAINLLRGGTFKDEESGFAQEVSDSIRKAATERGISGLGNGILTPGVTNKRFAQMEAQKRTVQSGSGTIASATNFTEVELPPIEMLRNTAVCMALGARMIPGLHGTPQFPRQNAAASSSWMAEAAAVTTSDPGMNFFNMVPHRLSMGSPYTRDFLALSNLAIDSFLAEDRYEVLALSLDYAGLAGSGTGNVPLGLQNYTGLATVLTGSTRAANGTVTAGAGGVPPTYVDLNDAEAAISGANAGGLGLLRWAGTPQARAAMRSILKFPGVNGSAPIMPDSRIGSNGLQEGPLGYDGIFSNQLPKNGTVNSVSNLHAMVLGNWPQMIIGDWDLNEIIADNITGAASAIYKIFEHGYYDINFRHIEAFVWLWVLAQ